MRGDAVFNGSNPTSSHSTQSLHESHLTDPRMNRDIEMLSRVLDEIFPAVNEPDERMRCLLQRLSQLDART